MVNKLRFQPMRSLDLMLFLAMFVASFVIYIRTLAPSLLFGDSAEFQTIAYTMGVGHPTGYPVYVFLAKLFTLISVGDVAYRVNLVSAFCAALTVALVYLILHKLGATIIACMCGAITLALTPLFWKHASIAEIYTASAMVLAIILLAVLFWRETNNPRWLFNVFDYYVYYIPALLVLAIFVGLGVNAILEVVTLTPKLPNHAPAMLGIVILGIGLYLSRADIATSWNERTPPGLDDWERYFYQFPDARRLEAEKIVSRLNDNASIFTDWDYAYDFYYVSHVLHGRTAMDFHETLPQDGVTKLADSTMAYIEANLDSRPIYFTERPSSLASKYKIRLVGSGLYQIKRE